MASPRAPAFCCAPPRGDPLSPAAPRDFQPRLWNGLCLGSAALGLLAGALLKALRRRQGRRQRPSGICRAPDERLVAARALREGSIASNWLGTAGLLAHSALWLAAAPFATTSPLCLVILAWVQFWFASHFWALFCYSLEAFLLLRNPTGHRPVAAYYLLCWGVPATQCLPGLLLLLSPLDAHCSSQQALAQVLDVVRYASTFVPLTLVFLGSPVLFCRALQAVPALLRRGRGMFTASERCQEQELRRKFTSIMAAFAACWMANVLHEMFSLLELEASWREEIRHMLRTAALTCWTVMAILNPLSGVPLILAFSSRRSGLCARKRLPRWRASRETAEDGAQDSGGSPPEATSGRAFAFLVDPAMLEVCSLLGSLESSTSVGFTCAAAENGSSHPWVQGVPVCQEESSPGGGSCKDFWTGAVAGK